MNAIAQIVEMDHERDRKTCINLDLKITGANQELAQWIADHRGKYNAEVIAGWIGCSPSRVKELRAWAEAGFLGSYSNLGNRQASKARRYTDDGELKSQDNFGSDDDFDPETGEITDDIASPAAIEDNILHALGGMNENARVFNKLLRASALDREAAARIATAIDRAIGKWRSIQSTLEKKG